VVMRVGCLESVVRNLCATETSVKVDIFWESIGVRLLTVQVGNHFQLEMLQIESVIMTA